MKRYDVRIIVNGYVRASVICDHVLDAMEYAKTLGIAENDRVTFSPALNGRRTTLFVNELDGMGRAGHDYTF